MTWINLSFIQRQRHRLGNDHFYDSEVGSDGFRGGQWNRDPN